MKSLRDEIRLAAEETDGFDFIHAVDFICIADFILAPARISLYNEVGDDALWQKTNLLICQANFEFYGEVL